jgi:hypothetical protein
MLLKMTVVLTTNFKQIALVSPQAMWIDNMCVASDIWTDTSSTDDGRIVNSQRSRVCDVMSLGRVGCVMSRGCVGRA